jgi:DeoR family transcriptional regulator, fructose operon transcriptional repressor
MRFSCKFLRIYCICLHFQSNARSLNCILSRETTPMSKDKNATLVRRHQKLLSLVEARGQMGVDELAHHFAVSDDTIRRDLQSLERRNLLLRTHGGAVSTALLVHRETPFLTRSNAHADAKRRIGRAAVRLITDGETLIINGGSTTFAFAASLGPRRNLTVVTNNVVMLSVLPAEAIQEVYLLGGQYLTNLGSTVGSVGFNSGSISVDTAVLGVSGLTATEGLCTTVLQEASMLARMITSARRTIVVADASKLGSNAFAQIAPLSAIDVLVTDSSPAAELGQALREAKVEVIVAPADDPIPRERRQTK